MTPPSGERADASQTCDRCGPAVRAVYHTRRIGELYLCRHCAYRLWSALSAQGWTIWLLEEDAPTPQPGPDPQNLMVAAVVKVTA